VSNSPCAPFVGLGFFQGGELAFGEDQLLPHLRHFGFERPETKLHGGEIVAQPDAANAKG